MAGVTMSGRAWDVITIGDLCTDLVVDLGETTIRFGQAEQWVSDYALDMGGSCALFACQAAKLGLRTALLGRVGDDAFGRLVLQRLQQAGVDTQHVAVDPVLKTGLGLHLSRRGDRAMLTVQGALNAVYPADVTDAWLASTRHLHYGSPFLQTNLAPALGDILRRAQGLGLSVSLDPNWDPSERWDGGLLDVLAHVDLLLLNEQEACALARQAAVDDALRALCARVPLVAIKRGAAGALVGMGESVWRVPVEPMAHIVDAVGAGDAFDAGFLAGWLRGLPPDTCAAIGNRCGRATLAYGGGLRGQPRLGEVPGLGRGEGS